MLKAIFSKVMWVGKATTFLIGLAVMLALVFGVATMALAGTGVGARFDLGKTNTVNAISRLVGSVGGPNLLIDNNSTNSSATALDLRVESGKPPLKVNSETKVDKLNADKLDGQDSTDFAPSLWAKVNADGTLLAGKGATSVTRGGGGYFVRFDRDIRNCAYIATVGETNTAYFDPGEVQATHSTGAGSPDRDVYVAMSDNDTGALARGFSLVVVC